MKKIFFTILLLTSISISGQSFGDKVTKAPVRVQLQIGIWDMTDYANRLINHGLTTSEWDTVYDVGFKIVNDENTNTTFQHFKINLQGNKFQFDIGLQGDTYFNSTDYDSLQVNRGFITFTYTPD
jgi:hypothetical protein